LVVQTLFPGVEVTLKVVIAAPPLLAGATHETVDWVDSNELPTTPVGAPGAADGTIGFDGSDAAPVPDLFVATTLNVYAVPLVRPVIGHVNKPVVVQNLFPGVAVTLYPVIAAPPSETGVVQVIVERPDSAAVAPTPIAVPGTVDGTAMFDGSDALPVPALFVAVIVNV
jgi:ethanolamine utilization microcompartment shell protein EutS